MLGRMTPTAPTLPTPSLLARHWRLDPNTVYLNHGSFGAVPAEIYAAQDRYRALMEADAVLFFVNRLDGLLDAARGELAAFLRCQARDLVFVPNATIAVATVLHNLRLSPGDEILVTEHEYPACMNAMRAHAKEWGATIVPVPVPFPIDSPDRIVEAFASGLSPRTRLAMISHVTSSSGLVLPARQIVSLLESRGVPVLVDGAHAPGFIDPLDLDSLGASYYTANLHKWLCAPKGAAFLHVREDRRANTRFAEGFRPLALSNWAERPKPGRSDFHKEFDYVGTQDFTHWCAVGDTIRIMAGLAPGGGGWPEIIRANRALCLRGRNLVCRALGIEPPAPDSMLGSLATIPLPSMPSDRAAKLASRVSRFGFHDALQDALLVNHRIQVPIWSVGGPWPGAGTRVIRIAAQLYNSIQQFEYLARALGIELRAEAEMA
jgi:isopenicillin-N epimerase